MPKVKVTIRLKVKLIVSEEKWTLFNVRKGNFKCFLIQKSIPNAYFFSFRWFLIYLITTPEVFLNQTHLVRLGIFHLELGKNILFGFSAPNFGDREPCLILLSF